MASKGSKIPVIAEKSYLKSVWCNEILSGIGKNSYSLLTLDEAENISENSVLVIVGTSNRFFEKAIEVCRRHNLCPMLIGAETTYSDGRISSIKTNRKAAIASLVHYCKSHGRSKTALFGISRHSNTDLEKSDAFTEASASYNNSADTSHSIYYNEGNIRECLDSFFKDISLYDSVICSNDYFAAALIIEASKRGINVPEDIFVTGYGNSIISERLSPSITTVTPKYREMGYQAGKIYSYLAENRAITSLELLVGYDIIVRESTGCLELSSNYVPVIKNAEPDFNSMFDDEYLKPVMSLDAIIGSSDKMLIQILDGIASDESYSSIAERLYLSDSAFRYKLNKIFALTNTSSKTELKQLRQNINLKDA